jgi:hypothetical protein
MPRALWGTVLVVVDAPVLDGHAGFVEAGEQLDGQQLVADAAAEALQVRGSAMGSQG